MSRRSPHADIARAAAAFNAVSDQIRAGNLDRLMQAQPGIRAATYDGVRVTGTGLGEDDRPDKPATGDTPTRNAATVASEARNAERALDAVRIVLDNYGPSRHATEADVLALQRANTRPAPHCEHHATVTEPHGDLPYLVDSWDGRNPTDVGGRLDRPMLLCRWCYDFVVHQGALPVKAQLEGHRDRGVARVRDTTPRRTA